jgi:hypothetical protein
MGGGFLHVAERDAGVETAVMKACRSVWGPMILSIMARRATWRTIRAAPWRSGRRPSGARKTAPSQRSPIATSAELFALARVAVRRDVAKIAMAGVVGSVACNATAWLGTVRLVRPLAVRRIPPAIAAGVLPLALLVATPRGRMGRAAGAALVVAYAVWVTVLRR